MRVFLGSIYFMFFVNISYAASNIDSHGVILVYHHVSVSTPPSTSISPADFERHLEYLEQNNFNVIPLDKMLTTLRAGTGASLVANQDDDETVEDDEG